jgi:ATP phosphoribosyltransferase regulatory subunit
VLHTRPAGPAATREPIQIGAELYGEPGVEADLEILQLLCQALQVAGVRNARIDIGHVAVFRAIAADLPEKLEAELFEALQRKDSPGLRELTRGTNAKTREALLLLPELYGGVEVLDVAEKKLPRLAQLTRALEVLRKLARACSLPVGVDLAELRGYHYHTGVVFDAYCDGPGAASQPIARGGRYDEVGKAFGRARPATGFSIDLRNLAAAGNEA